MSPVAHLYVSLPILAALLAAAWALGLRAGRRSARADGHALLDPLTGLPGRALFADRVAHALRAARREGACPAVLLVDLDHFGPVNEALGHEQGDLVLREVARRLQGSLRTSDTVARMGGDAFAVLVPRMLEEAECEEVATKLAGSLAEPLEVADLSLDLSLRVGAATYPRHGADAEALLRSAELALQRARARGTAFELHGDDDGAAPRRAALASELRRALNEGQVVTHFQPKVSLRTDEVVGFEALRRWTGADGAAVAPEEFIPVAEQTGLIGPATLMVLDAALAARQGWLAAGHDLTVAVNLSPRSLLDTRLPDHVAGLLARHGVPPAALELEITESVLMTDPERAGAVLGRLGAMGLHVAVDDFGTGYSSLSLLRRLPVDAIKIDRSFVMGMVASASDAAIVRSTVDLARNLGLAAVAEGVDTATAWRELRALGCDIAQGHLFGAAMDATEVVAWIEARGASGTGLAPEPAPLHGSTAPAGFRGTTR